MSTIAFESYSKWDFSPYLNRLNPIPVDKTELHYSLTGATAYAQNVNLSYVGQVISVVENGVVEVYKITPERTLEKISKGSIIVNTFNEALGAATNETKGSIVFVETKTYSFVNESGDTVFTTEVPEVEQYNTYDSGAYIIYGAGLLSKIGVSEASGEDVSSTIESIKSQINTIENTLNWVTDETGNPIKHKVRFWKGARASYDFLKRNNATDPWMKYTVVENNGTITEYIGNNQITVQTGQILPVRSVIDSVPQSPNPGDRYLVGTNATGYQIYAYAVDSEGVLCYETQVFDYRYGVRVIDRGLKNYVYYNGTLLSYDDVDCGEF